MQKISTMRTSGKKIFKGQLTIGLDLGDRSSSYCVLSEAGEVILEQKLPTVPEAMKQTFAKMPRIPLLANEANRFEATLLLGSAQTSEKIVDNRVGPGNHRFAGFVKEVLDPPRPHHSSNKVDCVQTVHLYAPAPSE